MNYIESLQLIHKKLQPKNYVEIGCRKGKSLTLAKCESIAIDPEFEIIEQLEYPTRIFKMTSDKFFQEYDIVKLFGNTIDLAFIDGMHCVEYALRDFINIEKNSSKNTIILFDDVLPEQIEWTTRERKTDYWTGDIYQIIPILNKYRPELKIHVLDIKIKGVAIVAGIDPNSTVLSENYSKIEKDILSEIYKVNTIAEIKQIVRPLPSQNLNDLLQTINKTYR